MFFAHADDRLKLLASQWKQNQRDTQEFQKTGGVYNAFDDFLGKNGNR